MCSSKFLWINTICTKMFEDGDLVMVFIPREYFSEGTCSKLKPRMYGPCNVLIKINDNVYVTDLSKEIGSQKHSMLMIYTSFMNIFIFIQIIDRG